MSKLRWLSVALLTLATTSAANAQAAPFSMLGLATLFNQETVANWATGRLPTLPQPRFAELLLKGSPFKYSTADANDEAEEQSMLPALVPECLKFWKEQWRLGNYLEAELLANIACRLDPANLTAQHALALSEIMQGLTGAKDACKACPGTECCKSGVSARDIERKLDEPISTKFIDTPLGQVIDELRTLAKLNIVPDRAALQDANISLDTPLTLAVEKISLRSVLKLLLDQARLTCVIKDEVLQITTHEKSRGSLRTLVFPVADLMASDMAMAEYLATALLPYARIAPGQRVDELLVNVIQTTVATDTWKDMGGRGAIQYFPLGHALVVSQTQDVQEDVAELLASLRRLQSDLASAATEAQTSAAEAACSAAAGAARACQAAAAKEMAACPACANAGVLFMSGQMAPLGFVLGQVGVQPGCCCTASGCFTRATPGASTRSIMVLPPPTATSSDDSDDAGAAVVPAPRMVEGSVFAVPPPIYVSGPYAIPPAPAIPPMTIHSPPDQATRTQLGQGRPAYTADNSCALVSEAVRNACATGQTCVETATSKQQVRLVTPFMEARCERLTSVGNPDRMLLEGDVELVCHRNGQVLRVQGQYIRVNVADGTFTVESMPERPKPASRAVSSASIDREVQPAGYSATWRLVPPVQPVNGRGEYEPYKPEE